MSYIFDVPTAHQEALPNGAELAEQVADYWVAFAADGDPNHDDAPRWPTADRGFLEFTVAGPRFVAEDPWRARLDAVRDAYLARAH